MCMVPMVLAWQQANWLFLDPSASITFIINLFMKHTHKVGMAGLNQTALQSHTGRSRSSNALADSLQPGEDQNTQATTKRERRAHRERERERGGERGYASEWRTRMLKRMCKEEMCPEH